MYNHAICIALCNVSRFFERYHEIPLSYTKPTRFRGNNYHRIYRTKQKSYLSMGYTVGGIVSGSVHSFMHKSANKHVDQSNLKLQTDK